MSWIQPLKVAAPRRKTRRRDGVVMPDTSKPIVINGVRYHSMAGARRALGWSYSKIYYAIGEGWRAP